MQLLLVGLSHKTAPVELREQLVVPEWRLGEVLGRTCGCADVAEAGILCTCNRTEFYVVGDQPREELQRLPCRLVGLPETDGAALQACLYTLDGTAVAEHLFRVAAGLDSMVVGEAEILGQVRRAHRAAMDCGMGGPVLDRLMGQAVAVGKRVRAQTSLGVGAASVASVAMDLAAGVFPDVSRLHLVVLGAGKTAEQVVRRMRDLGGTTLLVANRTFERAEHLAQQYGGHAVRFDHVVDHLLEADVLIASTAAPHAVIGRRVLEPIMRRRGGRPLMIIDIAVPRNVEPEVAELEGVHLYNIDDLQGRVAAQVERRSDAIPAAEALVAEAVQEFDVWFTSLEAAPTIRELRDAWHAVGHAELERLLRRAPELPQRERQLVEELVRRTVNRLLHGPVTALRNPSVHDDPLSIAEVRQLLGLEPFPPQAEQ